MADPQTTAPSTDAGAQAPPGRGRLPLIALAAVGLAVGAGTGALLVGPMLAKKLAPAPAITAPEFSDSDSAVSEGTASATPSVQLLENLVLNPAGSGGGRFLLLSIAIECSDSKVLSSMQARDAELRDIILTSLGSKTVDELIDIGSRDAIKAEIQTAIGERFGKKAVSRIYFPQFVVQ